MSRALTVFVGIALSVAACAPAPTPSDPGAPFASEDDYRQQHAAAVADLEAAIQTGATDAASCRTTMHTEQGCGGLTEWVVYSSETSDTTRVRELAERVTALSRKANAQFEIVSTCVAYQAPPATLENGRCITDL